MKAPRLRSEWVGKLVRSKVELRTHLAAMPAGTVFTVTAGHRLANLRSNPCPCCKISFMVHRVEWEFIEYIGLPPLTRPDHVPKLSGSEEGKDEEELAAFDIGVYDGEHGVATAPAQCLEASDRGRRLREAYDTGRSVGEINRKA